nr:uncharacterized protein LOC128705041 isoform X3 [Cherax quadricarinatus]
MSPQVNSLPHFPKVSGILAVRRIMYPGILPSTAGYLPFPTYPRSASTACILALLRFMYPGIHPLAPDVSPSPLTQGQPQLHVFLPCSGSCIQESIRSLRMSPLPHLPKVSLNCMYSCLAQVHVSRNPSARSGCLPFPTYPRSASTACILALLRFMYPGIHPLAPDVSPSPLTQGQPQQQPSSSSCIQESIRSLRMSSLPHFPKVGGAFPGSVSPGVHLCHLSGLPSPLPQSQRCLPRISVSRSPLVSPQVDSLPHFPRVSGAFPGSVSPGVH